eukprot:g18290.t1
MRKQACTNLCVPGLAVGVLSRPGSEEGRRSHLPWLVTEELDPAGAGTGGADQQPPIEIVQPREISPDGYARTFKAKPRAGQKPRCPYGRSCLVLAVHPAHAEELDHDVVTSSRQARHSRTSPASPLTPADSSPALFPCLGSNSSSFMAPRPRTTSLPSSRTNSPHSPRVTFSFFSQSPRMVSQPSPRPARFHQNLPVSASMPNVPVPESASPRFRGRSRAATALQHEPEWDNNTADLKCAQPALAFPISMPSKQPIRRSRSVSVLSGHFFKFVFDRESVDRSKHRDGKSESPRKRGTSRKLCLKRSNSMTMMDNRVAPLASPVSPNSPRARPVPTPDGPYLRPRNPVRSQTFGSVLPVSKKKEKDSSARASKPVERLSSLSERGSSAASPRQTELLRTVPEKASRAQPPESSLRSSSSIHTPTRQEAPSASPEEQTPRERSGSLSLSQEWYGEEKEGASEGQEEDSQEGAGPSSPSTHRRTQSAGTPRTIAISPRSERVPAQFFRAVFNANVDRRPSLTDIFACDEDKVVVPVSRAHFTAADMETPAEAVVSDTPSG